MRKILLVFSIVAVLTVLFAVPSFAATNTPLPTSTPVPITEILSDSQTVFQSVVGWIGQVLAAMLHPVILLLIGLFMVSVVIGWINRLRRGA